MSYTITAWRETGMTTQAKVDGLNNLETIYSEAVSYIDAITHSSSYYTDAQAATKFFTSSTDGSGSLLVCATLDGLTSQQIIDSGTPSGCIAIWSSTEGTIPSGWLLCDGTNSTPNLQDRFVVGAGGNYSVGNMGGSDTVTTTGTITIAGHSLTAAEIPKHTHGSITDYYAAGTTSSSGGSGTSMALVTGNSDVARNTSATGSGDAHNHTATFTGTSDQDKRPTFYALCFIMKS